MQVQINGMKANKSTATVIISISCTKKKGYKIQQFNKTFEKFDETNRIFETLQPLIDFLYVHEPRD